MKTIEFLETKSARLIRQNEMYRFGKTKCDYFV